MHRKDVKYVTVFLNIFLLSFICIAESDSSLTFVRVEKIALAIFYGCGKMAFFNF